MNIIDLIWTIAAFLLTLMVFSYILGDNFLFRLAMYIFIGVSSGYLAAVIIYQVLWPRLVEPILAAGTNMQELLILLIPAVLAVLLIFKLFPSLSRLGSLPVAFLVGIGAAVVVGGAVTGTVFGQIKGSLAVFEFDENSDKLGQLVMGLITLLGTVTTLIYFQFSAGKKEQKSTRRPAWMEALSGIGQAFIAITLGALFAGVYIAAMTALVDRVSFLRDVIGLLLK